MGLMIILTFMIPLNLLLLTIYICWEYRGGTPQGRQQQRWSPQDTWGCSQCHRNFHSRTRPIQCPLCGVHGQAELTTMARDTSPKARTTPLQRQDAILAKAREEAQLDREIQDWLVQEGLA